jgi:hypothetical protein
MGGLRTDFKEVMPQQATDLVAAQRAVTPLVRNGDSETIRVWIVGRDQIRAHLFGERCHRVHRALFLGVGKGDGGEMTIGFGLRGDAMNPLHSRAAERLEGKAIPHAVQGGIGDREITGERSVRWKGFYAAEVMLLEGIAHGVKLTLVSGGIEAQPGNRGVGSYGID